MPATTPEELARHFQGQYFQQSIKQSRIMPHLLQVSQDSTPIKITLWSQYFFFPTIDMQVNNDDLSCYAIDIIPTEFFSTLTRNHGLDQDVIQQAAQAVAHIPVPPPAPAILVPQPFQAQAQAQAQVGGNQHNNNQNNNNQHQANLDDALQNNPHYQRVYTIMVQQLIQIMQNALTKTLSCTNQEDIQLFYFLFTALVATEEHCYAFRRNRYLNGTTLRYHYIQRFERNTVFQKHNQIQQTATSTGTDADVDAAAAADSTAAISDTNDHVPIASMDQPVTILELLRVGRGYSPAADSIRSTLTRQGRIEYHLGWTN